VLVDWHAMSNRQTSWLYSDGTSLAPQGRPAYARIVLHTLDSD
jgi:hypothetical protein